MFVSMLEKLTLKSKQDVFVSHSFPGSPSSVTKDHTYKVASRYALQGQLRRGCVFFVYYAQVCAKSGAKHVADIRVDRIFDQLGRSRRMTLS